MDYIISTVDGFSFIPEPGKLAFDSSITVMIGDLKIHNFSKLCAKLEEYSNNVNFLLLGFDDVTELGVGHMMHFCSVLEHCTRLQQLSLTYIDTNMKDDCLSTLWQRLVSCKALTSLGISISSSSQVNEKSFNTLVEYLPMYPVLENIDLVNTILILTIEQKSKLKVALQNCKCLKKIQANLHGTEAEATTVNLFIDECLLNAPEATSSSPRNCMSC